MTIGLCCSSSRTCVVSKHTFEKHVPVLPNNVVRTSNYFKIFYYVLRHQVLKIYLLIIFTTIAIVIGISR